MTIMITHIVIYMHQLSKDGYEINMKALNKQVQKYHAQKEHDAWVQKQKEEQEYIDSLDDESRKKYLEEKERRRQQTRELIGFMSTVSTMMGGGYYK